MHYGAICNQGIGCTVSGGDRQMADYFGFDLDANGGLRIVYNDTTNQLDGAGLYDIAADRRQTITARTVRRSRAARTRSTDAPATPSGRTTRRPARARTSRSST